jgi:hypothetical protein
MGMSLSMAPAWTGFTPGASATVMWRGGEAGGDDGGSDGGGGGCGSDEGEYEYADDGAGAGGGSSGESAFSIMPVLTTATVVPVPVLPPTHSSFPTLAPTLALALALAPALAVALTMLTSQSAAHRPSQASDLATTSTASFCLASQWRSNASHSRRSDASRAKLCSSAVWAQPPPLPPPPPLLLLLLLLLVLLPLLRRDGDPELACAVGR